MKPLAAALSACLLLSPALRGAEEAPGVSSARADDEDVAEYRRVASEAVANAEAKLEEWNKAAEAKAGEARTAARREVRRLEESLQEQRDVLRRLSADSWRSMKKSASRSKEKLDKAYEAARRRLES